MDNCVSAGIATSHGSIQRFMRSSPIMSHGCTSTGMPRRAMTQEVEDARIVEALRSK
jgi:hypothetical protein